MRSDLTDHVCVLQDADDMHEGLCRCTCGLEWEGNLSDLDARHLTFLECQEPPREKGLPMCVPPGRPS